jgi:hypothetical protein
VLVIDTCCFELFLVLAAVRFTVGSSNGGLSSEDILLVDFLENVFESTVIPLQDRILGGQELATPL